MRFVTRMRLRITVLLEHGFGVVSGSDHCKFRNVLMNGPQIARQKPLIADIPGKNVG